MIERLTILWQLFNWELILISQQAHPISHECSIRTKRWYEMRRLKCLEIFSKISNITSITVFLCYPSRTKHLSTSLPFEHDNKFNLNFRSLYFYVILVLNKILTRKQLKNKTKKYLLVKLICQIRSWITEPSQS